MDEDNILVITPEILDHTIFAINNCEDILIDYLNNNVSGNIAGRLLLRKGVSKANGLPHTKESLYYYKKKIAELLGVKPSEMSNYKFVYQAPEPEPEPEPEPAPTFDIIDIDDYQDAKDDVTRRDPIMGLHAMVEDIEAFIENNPLDYKERMRATQLKIQLLEKIHKLDNNLSKQLDRKKLVDKLSQLSDFVAIMHEIANKSIDDLELRIKDFQLAPRQRSLIGEEIANLRHNLNIKDGYLDYIAEKDIQGAQSLVEDLPDIDLDLSDDLTVIE